MEENEGENMHPSYKRAKRKIAISPQNPYYYLLHNLWIPSSKWENAKTDLNNFCDRKIRE